MRAPPDPRIIHSQSSQNTPATEDSQHLAQMDLPMHSSQTGSAPPVSAGLGNRVIGETSDEQTRLSTFMFPI